MVPTIDLSLREGFRRNTPALSYLEAVSSGKIVYCFFFIDIYIYI